MNGDREVKGQMSHGLQVEQHLLVKGLERRAVGREDQEGLREVVPSESV